jgi:hypothetical protein
MPKDFWSKKQKEMLHQLREIERLDWDIVAERTGRTVTACKAKLAEMRGQRDRNDGRRLAGIGTAHHIALSPDQIAGRDARLAALQLRTQTQEFFGDPPPGFSALDEKRAQRDRRP